MSITQTIIPAAGFGTRFLPFTKVVPKELLPLLNKPAIHYIIQEAVMSGITHALIITADHKQALKDYLQPAPIIEKFLRIHHKEHLLDDINHLIQSIICSYVIQKEALGLGHAVSLARPFVTSPYISIMLPDDIFWGPEPALKYLIEHALNHKANVIAVKEVPYEARSSYGIVSIEKELSPGLFLLNGVVEKPASESAPSSLAINGRYVFSSDIFEALTHITPAVNGELQLTDAIKWLITHKKRVLAFCIPTTHYDIGIPSGWLAANNALASR